jgi:hypothetical protein
MNTDDVVNGKALNRRLRGRKLPQMVDWFDPLVLGMVGIRTLISTTIGEYADQRPMQEVVDGDKGSLLTRRHDYSTLGRFGDSVLAPEGDPSNPRFREQTDLDPTPPRQLKLDKGAMWVDFVADLGDGFEATYAIASLLAAPRLKIRGLPEADAELPAGQILIFGGDLAYPNATLEEYRTRCVNPYKWAFTADDDKLEPQRELFFVAGNHDWYDGLSAFTHQFCYESEAIGGWRCTQQRSYFSIRLPYNWWIWGVDVALGDSIDTGQLAYFKEVIRRDVEEIKRGGETITAKVGMYPQDKPKIILILHAPDWTKPVYKGLVQICELARQQGEICAILAGDLHHYSRYQSPFGKEDLEKKNPGRQDADQEESPRRSPPLHLIVAGGGGAFAHPTHDQNKYLEVDPTVAGQGLLEREKRKEVPYKFRGEKFYPSKFRSRALALKNLWLPFHNRRFAVLVGFVYLFYAWIFRTSVPKEFAPAPSESLFDLHLASPAALTATAKANPTFFFLLVALWVGLIFYVDARLKHRFLKWLNGPIKLVLGTLHFQLHLGALLFVSAFASVVSHKLFNPLIGIGILNWKASGGDSLSPTGASDGAAAAELGKIHDCVNNFDWSGVAAATWKCVPELLSNHASYIGLTALTEAATSIVVGGVIGAFVFGCYWVVTSVLFGMHQDAFSALAIKDYKNFLMLKFEENRLTIYPIALDRVPGPKEWHAWDADDPKDAKLENKPLLVPNKELRPRLIENPIIIESETGA